MEARSALDFSFLKLASFVVLVMLAIAAWFYFNHGDTPIGAPPPEGNAQQGEPPGDSPTPAPMEPQELGQSGHLPADLPADPPVDPPAAHPTAKEKENENLPPIYSPPTSLVGEDGAAHTPDADAGQADKALVLDRDGIKRVVGEMRPHVKRCYEKLLEDFPEAEGKVVLTFEIIAHQGAGRVDLETVRPDSSLHDKQLNQCLLDELRELEFPLPDGDGALKVSYPFLFTSSPD